jgi:hypothetical protein
MQHSEFSNGGFVLHRIAPRGRGEGKISAWFNRAGELLDSVYIDTLNRERATSDADKAHCRNLGKIYRKRESV